MLIGIADERTIYPHRESRGHIAGTIPAAATHLNLHCGSAVKDKGAALKNNLAAGRESERITFSVFDLYIGRARELPANTKSIHHERRTNE